MLDDFHIVSTPNQPITKLQKSTAIHMATSLIDLPHNVPAIVQPSDFRQIHRVVDVTVRGVTKSCRGGISSVDVLKVMRDHLHYHRSYLESLPDVYRSIKPESAEKQVKELG